jgi:Spy/CpxP family protein refolding chaperone
MKKLIHAAAVAVSLAGSALMAQQPGPPPSSRQPGPPVGQPPTGEAQPRGEGAPQMRRMGRPAPGGIGMAVYSPTALLERRSMLNLTADQVTRLATLENDLKAARQKAETDAKPHRDELEKLWEQATPDVAQVRVHAQAMMQAQQAAQLLALTTTAQAKAVLTAEQRGRVQGWADARGPGGQGRSFRRMSPGSPGGPPGPGARGFRRAPGPRGAGQL